MEAVLKDCQKCDLETDVDQLTDGVCPNCQTMEALEPENKIKRLEVELEHLRTVTAHGDQPLERGGGTIRFRENRIVQYLLAKGPSDLTMITAKITVMGWEHWELAQLLQLIGSPIARYTEAISVTGETYNRARESERRFKEEEEAKPMTSDKALAILSGICILCGNCGDAYALTAERWSTQKPCDNCGSTSYTVKEG